MHSNFKRRADAANREIDRKRILEARACSCHSGSVCGDACKRGLHHDGCPKATKK